ncbi:MAG: hypothetical protein ACYS9Y_14050 [Planctomycetota bacterium]|jgi:hypothetical protein
MLSVGYLCEKRGEKDVFLCTRGLRHPTYGMNCFWVENRGGGLRNVKKMKKKRQKVHKSSEKEAKKRKIEKNDAKRCTKLAVFSKLG